MAKANQGSEFVTSALACGLGAMDAKIQVERLLDENPRKRRFDIIVQMKLPDDQLRSLLDATAQAVRRRHMTSTARDLLPAKADLVKARNPTVAQKRKLRSYGASMASQVASIGNEAIEAKAMEAGSKSALRALVSHDVVQKSFGEAEEAARSAKTKAQRRSVGPARTFWTSQSAAMKLDRDELHAISKDVDDIRAVIMNREISLPPILEASSEANNDLKQAAAWGLEKTGVLAAWGAYGARGGQLTDGREDPVSVAVLDTGVDMEHPELKDRVVEWAEFDSNGDLVAGSTAHDSGEHGTHVCGIIAGQHPDAPAPGTPFLGAAPGVELLAGMVLNRQTGTVAQILAGIEWAIESGAEIINMSLGSATFEPDVDDLFSSAFISANTLGIPVVVAIGNEGAQTSSQPANDYFAFAVGATDRLDRSGGFSGGRTQVIRKSELIDPRNLPLIYSKPDVSAPGVGIRSCIPRGRYATWNGTSMAAPLVSAAMALLLSATSIRSVPADRRAFLLQDLLISTVDELGESGKDHRFGFGRINVLRAIARAKDLGY